MLCLCRKSHNRFNSILEKSVFCLLLSKVGIHGEELDGGVRLCVMAADMFPALFSKVPRGGRTAETIDDIESTSRV